MNINREDLLWFTRPTPSIPQAKPRMILPTEGMYGDRHNRIGKPGMTTGRLTMSDGRLWATVDGDYVTGLHTNEYTGGRCMWIAGDSWGFGMVSNMRDYGDSPSIAVIADVRRADGMQQPHDTLTTTAFFPCADWGHTLFPMPTDSPAVVEAKVALAKAKWVNAYARWKISVEAHHRGWHDQLDEIRDDVRLGALVYRPYVQGRVMRLVQGGAPVGLDPVIVGALTKASPTASTESINMYATVEYSFLADMADTSLQTAMNISGDAASLYARRELNEHSINFSVSSVTAVPCAILEYY